MLLLHLVKIWDKKGGMHMIFRYCIFLLLAQLMSAHAMQHPPEEQMGAVPQSIIESPQVQSERQRLAEQSRGLAQRINLLQTHGRSNCKGDVCMCSICCVLGSGCGIIVTGLGVYFCQLSKRD